MVQAAAGDLVQVDTLDVSLMPGVHFEHFTVRDMVSRWDVLQVSGRATANNAARFLETVQQRLPFSLKEVRWKGAVNSWLNLNKAMRKMVSDYLYCHHVHRIGTGTWNGCTAYL